MTEEDPQHMDHDATAHGSHEEASLPEPNGWPLIVALSALALGAALFWFGQDTGRDVAGPVFGAAIVTTVIAAVGWLFDTVRSRRRAAFLGDTARPSRFTQVITFAIAEGQLEAARSASGVLTALDHANSALRRLPGFQDIRIVVSPASVGPSQAIAETSWWDKGALASYDETRQTVLDLINGHSDEIVAGSVQVFDMEVVRDAKEVTVGLGLPAAGGLLAAVIIGGFAIGAGLSAFSKGTTTVAPPAGGEQQAGPETISATNTKFNKAALSATAGTEFEITFKNADQVPHNLHFYDAKGGKTLADGAEGKIIQKGQSESLKFTVAAAGNYYFQCDLHPDQMNGSFTVK